MSCNVISFFMRKNHLDINCKLPHTEPINEARRFLHALSDVLRGKDLACGAVLRCTLDSHLLLILFNCITFKVRCSTFMSLVKKL